MVTRSRAGKGTAKPTGGGAPASTGAVHRPANALLHGLTWHLEQLPEAWKAALRQPDVAPALQTLAVWLDERLAAGAQIFPHHPFRALELTPPDHAKVIILGQDPYHGPDQAQGLAFSVPDTTPSPPSLRNILAELQQNYPDQRVPAGHDLTPWARQGVLLLNAVLTVESGKPGSHAKRGWERVTDALLAHVLHYPTPKVFLLWGAHAQQKRDLISTQATGPVQVLAANHPSPLSARRPPVPFMGSGHFRAANDWLRAHDVTPIDWAAPPQA